MSWVVETVKEKLGVVVSVFRFCEKDLERDGSIDLVLDADLVWVAVEAFSIVILRIA